MSSRLRIKEILFVLEIVDRDRDNNLSHIIATYELDLASVMCALVINHNSFNLATGAFLIHQLMLQKMRMHVARCANDRALDSSYSLLSGTVWLLRET